MDVLDPLQLRPAQKSPLAPLIVDELPPRRAARPTGLRRFACEGELVPLAWGETSTAPQSTAQPWPCGMWLLEAFLWHLFIIGNVARNHRELFPSFFRKASGPPTAADPPARAAAINPEHHPGFPRFPQVPE